MYFQSDFKNFTLIQNFNSVVSTKCYVLDIFAVHYKPYLKFNSAFILGMQFQENCETALLIRIFNKILSKILSNFNLIIQNQSAVLKIWLKLRV